MSKIVVFKSYACKLEYFKSVEIVYPDKQNKRIGCRSAASFRY